MGKTQEAKVVSKHRGCSASETGDVCKSGPPTHGTYLSPPLLNLISNVPFPQFNMLLLHPQGPYDSVDLTMLSSWLGHLSSLELFSFPLRALHPIWICILDKYSHCPFFLIKGTIKNTQIWLGRVGGGGFVAKSCPTLVTPWTVACQAPLSVVFSRQEYWSGLPFPSPGNIPDPGIEPRSPELQADSLLTELWGKP